jgi:hypothetical protein
MPRGQLTKDIIKCEVLKIKSNLDKEWMDKSGYDPKWLAHQYLNRRVWTLKWINIFSVCKYKK